MLNNKKTLDGILSTFSKTLVDLETLIHKNKEQSDSKQEQAATLITESNVLIKESQKAQKVRDNITKLLDK